MITYEWIPYSQLTVDQFHDILKLRQDVFVIEQNCPYDDIDGQDRSSWHLLGCDDGKRLLAYLRLVDPGVRFEEPALSRIVTHAEIRGSGVGREIMEQGIRKAMELYPGRNVRLSAQQYAKGFYESLGFRQVSEPYDEDGILHIEMLLEVD